MMGRLQHGVNQPFCWFGLISPLWTTKTMATSTTDADDHQQQDNDDSDQVMTMINDIDGAAAAGSEEQPEPEQPQFPKLSAAQAAAASGGSGNRRSSEYRRVRCPPHRYTPLREHWEQILTPLVEYLKLQVRVVLVLGPPATGRGRRPVILLSSVVCRLHYCSFFLPCKG
jgi:hypothetical protein